MVKIKMVWAAVAIVLIAIIVGASVYYFYYSTPPEQKQNVAVAMVLPGSINDHGFNQGLYEALILAQNTFSVDVDYSEAVQMVDAPGVFRDYADRGYNLIFCCDFGHRDAALKVASEYPNIIFELPYYEGNMTNVFSWTQGNIQYASYLAGFLATGLSKSGIIATMGSMPAPPIIAFQEGFKLGCKAYAEANKKPINVLQQFVGSWEDVSMGYETSMAFIDAEADLIYGCGDGINFGAIMAAKSRGGVYFIGGAGDQRSLDPDTVIASVRYSFEEMVLPLVNKTLHNEDIPAVISHGAEFLIDYDALKSVVPTELQQAIESAEADMKAGILIVPHAVESTPPYQYAP